MTPHWKFLLLLTAFLVGPVAADTKKKSITIEIHDASRARLVRSVPASALVYGDVLTRVGRLQPTHAVVIRCDGYGYGMITNDLFYAGGRQNEELMVAPTVPLRIVCEQMELSLKLR